MREAGLNADGQPKHANVFIDQPFDLVVTVCDDAAENCPVWLGRGRKVHLGFEDPAEATGTDAEVMAVYKMVFNQISTEIPALLERELFTIEAS